MKSNTYPQFRLAGHERPEAKVRYTRRVGSSGIFGPFTNQQRGLWNADGGGSACWKSCFPQEETCIEIENDTSFVGLWAEVMSVSIIGTNISHGRVD